MKKAIYFIILFFGGFIIARAEGCNVISGDGTKIGDEITCGTEHFYVISNDGKNIKMLSKYNLLVGETFERITFSDFSAGRPSDIYTQKEVQEKIIAGYDINTSLYNYDSTTHLYTFSGAIMSKDSDNSSESTAVFLNKATSDLRSLLNNKDVQKNLNDGYSPSIISVTDGYLGVKFVKNEGYEYKTIILDEAKSTNNQILLTEEAQTILNKGYILSNYINSSDGYIGATFYKQAGYEYKTITFESQSLSKRDYFEREDVKKLLEDGYRPSTTYTNYSTTCSTNTKKCVSQYWGGIFYKSDYYDYSTIIFEENVSQSEIDTYLANNSEVQTKFSEGYEFLFYTTDSVYTDSGITNPYIGITLYKENQSSSDTLNFKYVYQDKTAIGAHGNEKGNPDPIEIGVISPYNVWGGAGEKYSTGYQDYEYYEDNDAYYYLQSYYSTLKKNGYNILDINSITVTEINELVKSVTGENIPLEEWYSNSTKEGTHQLTGNTFRILGSIKELLPEKYSWLWSTTYWTRTADATWDNIYFVDTLGDLCASDYCINSIGAGLRPVVTISTDDIVFNVTTKTDGNGTITVEKAKAGSGEQIKFTIIPKFGYVLGSIKVTDKSGNTIILDDNTFTMPNADVTIEATFVTKNPDTKDIAIINIIVIGFIAIFINLKNNKKLKWLK